jgi:excisionase family DNA binding protein
MVTFHGFTVSVLLLLTRRIFMPEKEISVAEAARRMGVALTYVYSLVWAGKLKAHKVDGKWQVSAAAVKARLQVGGE